MKSKKMKKADRRWMAVLAAAVLAVSMAGCTRVDQTKKAEGDHAAGGTKGVSSGSQAEEKNINAQQTAADAKGRYIETQINTPEDFDGRGTIKRLDDGSLMLLDTKNGTISMSSDEGKTWDTQTLKQLVDVVNRGGAEITAEALAADGSIFFSYIIWGENQDKEKTYAERYVYIKPDETVQEFELGLEDYNASLTEAAFSPDGRLFAATNSCNVHEIHLKKQSAKQLFSVGAGEIALDANKESLIVTDGSKVYFYNLKTAELTDEDQVLNDYVKKQSDQKSRTFVCSAKNGADTKTLYVAGSGGIAGHAVGGSVMELLADGALNNLGDLRKVPNTMIHNEDGSFLILYTDGELDSYVYDAGASAVPAQQLTIYSLYDNETVRQAVSVFRKKNSDAFVRLEVGMSGDNGMTEKDAVNNLNTELLAGEGPDLILLDGMPMDSYKEKGMLLDLSDIAADLESGEEYFQGILKGYAQEDGIYALPFRYEIPLLAGETSVLSGITDLKTLADTAERLADQSDTEETVMGSYLPEELLEKLYVTCAGAWITKEGTIDKEALTEFFTQAKRIYNADQKNLDADERTFHSYLMEERKKQYSDEEFARTKRKISVWWQLARREEISAGFLSTMSDLMEVTSLNKQLGNNTYQLLAGQETDLFCPTGTVGVSANSKRQDLAVEFIKTLFSKNVQQQDLGDGFPVNAEAFEDYAANPYPATTSSGAGEDRDGNKVRTDYIWPDEQETAQLKELIQSLKNPANVDNTMKQEVLTIGAKALSGEKGVEQCVEEIAQKISIYLQE